MNTIRENVLRYFESLWAANDDQIFMWPNFSSDGRRLWDGAYKYAHGISRPNIGMLYPSVFAALARGLCDDIPDEEKHWWAFAIKAHQDPEHGWFKNVLRPHDQKIDTPRRWRHLTEHSVIALRYLDAVPNHEFTFLREFHDPDRMITWLSSLDWDNPWKMSNWVMEVALLLQYERDVMGIPNGARALEAWFDWHDKHQCRITGFWGNDTTSLFGRISPYGGPYNALYGAYHQFLVYYYERRPINHHREIVDTVLNLQHENGSFREDGGNGACEDIDAADVLVNMHLLHDYRRDEIQDSLRLILSRILEHQMDDGGFTYENGKEHAFVWLDKGEPALGTSVLGFKARQIPGDSDFPEGRIIRPHKHMTVPSGTSTAFATWFRLLSLASISRVIDDVRIQSDWRFINCPGFHFDIRDKLSS